MLAINQEQEIEWLHILNNNKKALQGEKIETPSFINENKLELDYGHYIMV